MSALISTNCPFILASASPRRRALLEQINMSFCVVVSPADEHIEGDPCPEETVRQLAQQKVQPVAAYHPSALVLAADTVVAHEGTILEKPETDDEAYRMLTRLSGTTHAVHTGFALSHLNSTRTVDAVETTTVSMGALSETEIEAYIRSGSPFDKAGGYGIQDHTAPLFIDGIEGDYYTVVGLPLRRLYQLLHDTYPDLLTLT